VGWNALRAFAHHGRSIKDRFRSSPVFGFEVRSVLFKTRELGPDEAAWKYAWKYRLKKFTFLPIAAISARPATRVYPMCSFQYVCFFLPYDHYQR
jgi:hypothetical protein